MFEHDQDTVQRLLVENLNFKLLYTKHQELNEKVDRAGSGVLALDDVTLENLKKERLLLKDKMALLIAKHRPSPN